MTWLEIRPQDVWLFRDGKPFSAGEDHSAHSMFPPTPLTVQGALRQKISVSLGVSFHEYKHQSTPEAKQAVQYIGSFDERLNTGNFRMTGPFVGLRTDSKIVPLIPTPADLFKHDKHHDFFISRPSTRITSDLVGNYGFPEVKPDYENLPNHWMTADIFADYLAERAPDPSVFFTQDGDTESEDKIDVVITTYKQGQRIWPSCLIYQSENRFGVSTDAVRSFRDEGLLYQVQFIRPHSHISLLSSVEGVPEELLLGVMSLGGEHRLAHVFRIETPPLPMKPAEVSGQFKVVVLTPAYFEHGWQPKDWSVLFGGHPVKCISAALYRPQRIGGWKSAARHVAHRVRTMHHYVSPGSVYYFETNAPFTPPVAFTQTPEGVENAAYIGFGQYAIGQWNLE